MIFLRIVSKSELQIEEIAKVLLEEKLAIDVNIKRHIERAELVNEAIVFSQVYLLTAKTRALLFDSIDSILNELYPTSKPEVYGLPIMEMDWKKAESVTQEVKQDQKLNRLERVLSRLRKIGSYKGKKG